MVAHSKRVHTVLSEDQFTTLERLAIERGKPVSALIREAVEQAYFSRTEREQRLAALDRLLALDAPVANWPRMEEEIARGSIE